jgi:hypothetical protein
VLSSHLLDEVERTCGAVAIVDCGSIIRQGPIPELLAGAPGAAGAPWQPCSATAATTPTSPPPAATAATHSLPSATPSPATPGCRQIQRN